MRDVWEEGTIEGVRVVRRGSRRSLGWRGAGGGLDRRFINAGRKDVIGSRVCLDELRKEMKEYGSCVVSHACSP